MSIKLYCDPASKRVPYRLILELSCDKCKVGGFMPRTYSERFIDKGGFPAMRAAATEAGWRETVRGGERLFIGPCCTLKKRRK